MITGISHITLSVRDVDESFDFYTQILGCRPVARWAQGAYLVTGDTWLALHLDLHCRKGALPEYTHVALGVQENDFEALSGRIRQSGAQIWQENRSEGRSLYLIDPNGHKLEIHASDLQARLQAARAQPWEGLQIF